MPSPGTDHSPITYHKSPITIHFSPSPMPMAMMQIRVMRVRMNQFFMVMNMGMRFTRRIGWCVRVLMMLIMPVQMVMRDDFVAMLVSVLFRKMQPNADHHETTRNPEQH